LLELTAIGENINVAARLASVAAPGELLCSETAYVASGIDHPAERRDLTLKGVSANVSVRVLRSN
jgi:class 3 adenylate cyclase